MKNTLILLYGRSCVGKTTTVRELQDRMGDELHEAVSVTTRPIRPNEEDGIDYTFVDQETFNSIKGNHELVESVEYNGNCYGLALSSFDSSKTNIAIVEPIGVTQIKEVLKNMFNIVIVKLEENDSIIFERFAKRGDATDVVYKRAPRDKVKFAEQPYDYMINADVDLLEFIIKKHKEG